MLKSPVKKKKNKTVLKATPKVSYYSKPTNLSMEEWQLALRKQFAELNSFNFKNVGTHLVFSDYNINSSETKKTYKVSIRSEKNMNFCECMDFKTNNLGTCKHIEHILFKINKNNKLKKIYKNTYDSTYTSVYLNYKGERTICIRIGSENSEEFKKLAKIYFDINGVLIHHSIQNFDKFLEKANQISSTFRCYDDALNFVLNEREHLKRNEIIDKNINSPEFFKSILKADLFQYQKEGIEFGLRNGRVIIADDMGLGKTIQAIGVAEGLKKLVGISKILIVCPTSLKYQWKSELEKFTKSSFQVIEGNFFKRKELYENNLEYKICSYHVIAKDLDTINVNDFDLVILDEAQRIKNWQTKTAQFVKKIKSKYVIVLTGTPIENKLDELYSLVQMVDPFKLGALFSFLNKHQNIDDLTGKIIGYKKLNDIGVLLKNSLIRRHKKDVLKQLPSRMDKNLFVPMTKEQRILYEEYYDVVAKLVNKWIRQKFLNEKDRQTLLIFLNLMRMVCNSTYIVDQTTRFDTKIHELFSILDNVFSNDNENGHEKVVIFSQWERMTRIIALELEARKIQFENLHGGIASKDREKLFSNFNNNSDSKVFLSTDAGGVGLNLQVASIVINMDLPWNPAVLEQRIARVHRLGQKRNVQVINFISANTIENEMLGKLGFKSALATGVLDHGDDAIFLEDSKFNILMKEVSEMTASENKFQFTSEEDEIKDFEKPKEEIKTNINKNSSSKENEQKSIEHFQKELVEESEAITNENDEKSEQINLLNQNESEHLIQSGTDFFGKLIETLSNKTKTEELINNLVKTDDKTGETYLKIPVKSKEIIENGLKLFGKLFGGN
jgi:SNF2 family DNA or RNA helicase